MPPFNFPPLDLKVPHRTEAEKAHCKHFFEVWDELLEDQQIANGMPPVDMSSNNIYTSRLKCRENTGNQDNFERIIRIYVYHHEYTVRIYIYFAYSADYIWE